MKHIVLSGLLALAAACGGSDAGGDTNASKKVQVEDEKAACSEEIALECEEGLVDACSLTPAASTVHACVAEPVPDEVVPTEEDLEESEAEEEVDTTGEE